MTLTVVEQRGHDDSASAGDARTVAPSTSTTTTSLAIRNHAYQSRPALTRSRRGAGSRAGRKTGRLGHANITQTSKCPATRTPGEHKARRFEERIGRLTPIDTGAVKPPQNAQPDNIATREAIQQNTTKHETYATRTSLLTGGLLVRIQPEEPFFSISYGHAIFLNPSIDTGLIRACAWQNANFRTFLRIAGCCYDCAVRDLAVLSCMCRRPSLNSPDPAACAPSSPISAPQATAVDPVHGEVLILERF